MTTTTSLASGSDSAHSTPVRFVTAASLFDGHDASINIMRRILQAQGAEVIHLGHDRSVDDVVRAAVEEDAHGIAISSYQGGHNEYFSYMVQRLAELGRPDIRVFGGGGGTITDKEIAWLHEQGVCRIYSVEDGRRLGLEGMIRDMVERARRELVHDADQVPDVSATDGVAVARLLTMVEAASSRPAAFPGLGASLHDWLAHRSAQANGVVVGITGTGGAGKSSLTDELVRRLLQRYPDLHIAVLSIDPTRRRTGGALLGDRIRMNSAGHPRVFMRSMATREANRSMSAAANDAVRTLRAVGFPLIIVETAGIGQSGSEIVEVCDIPVYVMTPEYGAPSQLEKIDMLDWAQVVAINKADRFGAEDAQRYVARQMIRNRQAFHLQPAEMPVYLCCANRFADAGVDALASHLADLFDARLPHAIQRQPLSTVPATPQTILPARRTRYLSEISDALRSWRRRGEQQIDLVFRADGIRRAAVELGWTKPLIWGEIQAEPVPESPVVTILVQRWNELQRELDPVAARLLNETPALLSSFADPENVYEVRGKQIRVQNYTESLSGTGIAKVAVPRTADASELLRWRWFGNVPGEFPYTTGVFAYKRVGEDPTRMFAGEGMPERTNRRFHYLSKGQPAIRLSTAFDSVTLYGRDPAPRPDVWGKVGNSGVSVCTLDDAKRLYSGFDLTAPSTSVSMTINGPAPAILAMYFNTAIDQAVERRLKATGRWEVAERTAMELRGTSVAYRGEFPPTHDGGGLGLLGISGDQLLDADEYESIRAEVLAQVRGTVQADILKEDQAQNTCIFSTEFALRMMGDIQEYFNKRDVRNFYSVSISGYHIAEAGANPITQLAFTLANGFTFVEYYRSRGMDIDLFARNLSFFFSNGIDAEYTVIGRVARRIWAVAMRDLYGANPRSQQLKYHIQTSGRSLHAQEIDFNDIRTTLQAFYAIADNCNSLHTNAYDEAITTPTEESVRRAVAIQLILNREFGMLKNENPLQGAYFVEQLTDLVEEAVLAEFDRISDRGGVLGAMELMYQRSRIQEESMVYEHRKHSGELPIIGVNTFLNPRAGDGVVEIDLVRAGDDEKQAQLDDLKAFHQRNEARSTAALQKLQEVALAGDNIFAELMETVKSCSLGQITDALFNVGGQYRRNM